MSRTKLGMNLGMRGFFCFSAHASVKNIPQPTIAPGFMSDDGALSTGSVSIVVARKEALEASGDRPSTEIDSARWALSLGCPVARSCE